MKFLYKAWFPKDYNIPSNNRINSELLGNIAEDLRTNHLYNVAVTKKGVMKITVPGEFEQTLPDCVIRALEKTGLIVEETRLLKDLTADQLFEMETAARERSKTILPIETLKRGLRITVRDAPYGSATAEEPLDCF